MRYKPFVYLLIIASLIACSNQKASTDKIKELETKLYAKSDAAFSKETANELIQEYVAFADANKKDSLSPAFLYNAAQIAMGMNLSKQAIEIFKRVYEEYPDYDKASTCLFLQGFVYETQENDNAKAQKMYQEFISKYPNHILIDDAKFSLENLDKSDEEIIREFEQRIANNKDSI
ncbi:MAG TPA: tetratricopeptide repeat protein [Flavobacteriales bacterium]|nr:tetratricopeptide repeat protein [Flavobacteriales bacterium]